MNIDKVPYSAIWYEDAEDRVLYIDQTRLPWELVIRELKSFEDGVRAIKNMEVRGAPLIGVAAAFSIYVGAKGKLTLQEMGERLIATRPTAVNLAWAVAKMLEAESTVNPTASLLERAVKIRDYELDCSFRIGEAGLKIIREISGRKGGEPVNILTHCNAGWLATVDYGTALAPVYLAHDRLIPVHVWVDETRPRNQGAKLTAYELTRHGVPNTLIVDNAGGLLMQQGLVDLVIVGADRITANGDVVNKIGTYLKALAAFDNQVPFYVAAPRSTFDRTLATGKEVTIEERDIDEVLYSDDRQTRIAIEGTRVHNPGFDITPARLVTGYFTEES